MSLQVKQTIPVGSSTVSSTILHEFLDVGLVCEGSILPDVAWACLRGYNRDNKLAILEGKTVCQVETRHTMVLLGDISLCLIYKLL